MIYAQTRCMPCTALCNEPTEYLLEVLQAFDLQAQAQICRSPMLATNEMPVRCDDSSRTHHDQGICGKDRCQSCRATRANGFYCLFSACLAQAVLSCAATSVLYQMLAKQRTLKTTAGYNGNCCTSCCQLEDRSICCCSAAAVQVRSRM